MEGSASVKIIMDPDPDPGGLSESTTLIKWLKSVYFYRNLFKAMYGYKRSYQEPATRYLFDSFQRILSF
jgi:hypothetical protein